MQLNILVNTIGAKHNKMVHFNSDLSGLWNRKQYILQCALAKFHPRFSVPSYTRERTAYVPAPLLLVVNATKRLIVHAHI